MRHRLSLPARRAPLVPRGTAWPALVLVAAGCATGLTSGPTGAGGSVSTSTSKGTGAATAAATGTGGGDTGGAGTGGVVSPEIPCSPGMPCNPGKTCVNGVCADGCNTDANCGTGQYCDLTHQVCLDDSLTACPAMPCAATQVCVEGLCGTQPSSQQCGPGLFGCDGCMNNELCLQNVVVDGKLQSTPACYVLPTCSTSHPCTVGGMGAICSTGLITGKDDFCIPGGCATDANCPASWTCIPPVSTSMGYGQCTDGASGMPCGNQSDCKAGLTCHIPVQDMFGTCE
jgi:hypothetical protein